MMQETAKAGFVYKVEVVKDGVVTDSSIEFNRIPMEGINHMLDVVMNGAAQVAQWYVGVYENDYTPQSGDTAATLPALAAESSAYESVTRPQLVTAPADAGLVDNSASKVEMVFTAKRTVRGGFISSSNTKGGTAGVLGSVVRFSSPKEVDVGATLVITAGLQITSAN